MKTNEELNAIKEEVETLNKKLADLTEEELAQVSGGASQNPMKWGVIVGYYWSNTYGTGPANDKLIGQPVIVEYVVNAAGPLKFRLWRNGTAVGWTVPACIQYL